MSNQQGRQLNFFLYARKSEENEDRQVQSIEDQVQRMTELAATFGYHIKETFFEAKSAKKPNNRPKFTEMITRISKGEADGILCWQINRLSRNPIDSGTISWMLQQGTIQCIQTIDKRYLPDDNVLLFNVESSMANQFIIDLKKNVRRGVLSKAEKGWYPTVAPLGYVNDKLTKTIKPDKQRFALVQKMWDMMLTGKYTPNEIRNIATKEWGFRTKKFKRQGGATLSYSVMYKMFSNVFYTGMFEWGGKLYSGKHKPMVSVEEFDHIQILLGRRRITRAQKHEFPYTGLIRCGVCGCRYTAFTKTKLNKTTGRIKSYTYYNCTRRSKTKSCNITVQKPLSLSELEIQIEQTVDKFTIAEPFLNWAVEALEDERKYDETTLEQITATRQRAIVETEKELANLNRMRYRELVDEDFFIKERDDLSKRIVRLKHELSNITNPRKHNTDKILGVFNFAAYARKKLLFGSIEEKREVLSTIGLNRTVIGKKLIIESPEWLIPIQKAYPSLYTKYRRFELEKNLTEKERNAKMRPLFLRWLTVIADVRKNYEKEHEEKNDENSSNLPRAA